MAFSLGIGHGLNRMSVAGDFGNRMWSSYTQLNPGVYSEAIATEFKRRMKPDYVENLVPNGGGLNATDLIDSNSDGLADGFTGFFSNYVLSIVSGNGFSGRAHRITKSTSSGDMGIFKSSIFSLATSYTITFKYRTNSTTAYIYNAGATPTSTPLPVNTGSALPFTFTGTINNYVHLLFACLATNVGDYLEVGEITVTRTISQNYFTTFGPSGLNKTTADWIYLLTTSGDIASRTITKSGALLKWNLDGVTVTQNNLPAYTKGANAGVVTMTSTDGYDGVTTFSLNANSFTNTCPTFNFHNATSFNVQGSNFFSGNVPNWIMPKVTVCYFNANLFSGIVPNHNFPLITAYYLSANAGITGFAGNGVVTNNMSIEISNNMMIPTSGVDARLKAYNTMFAATPPIKNLTLNLSGATMGIPTGGNSNVDLVGIMNKFGNAGFTATISIRTS